MTNEERFSMIAMEMYNIYVKKNADYGNSFDKSLDEDGLLVSKIRLGDKYNRFSQLIGGEQQVSDESKRDTLLDMANYAIMTIMWMDDLFTNDITEDTMIGKSPQANPDGNTMLDSETYFGMIKDTSIGADVDGDKLMESLSVNIAQYKEWANDLEALRKRGLSNRVFDYLCRVGPADRNQLDLLKGLCDSDLKRYCILFGDVYK